jgi:hypothetical protein
VGCEAEAVGSADELQATIRSEQANVAMRMPAL